MNELERIVREAARLEAEGSAYLLATVVRVSGSSYRRPGARMLVAGESWISGCVSGGCLEGDVMLRGAHRARGGAVVVTYDSSTEEGEAWGVGLGCNGVVDVLLEHVAAGSRHDGLAFAGACFAAESAGTLVTIIGSTRPGAIVGARLTLGPLRVAPIGHPDRRGAPIDHPDRRGAPIDDPVVTQALEAAARGAPGVASLRDLGVTALVERIAPSPQLFVLGSAHDAAPLVTIATSIGARVTVVDRAVRGASRFPEAERVISTGGDWDRVASLLAAATEPYVVIMHHQRDADLRALRVALASPARYIGVLGPAQRTRELLGELGLGLRQDDRVHAPIGLDVGAETPEQIAVAIAAELQAVRLRRRGGMLRDRARALHADVAIAVLAAGGSRRLGRPKQLVDVGGAPLVHRVAATCADAGQGPVAVVVGAHAAAVSTAIADLPVAIVENDAWEEGIASSIRAAVRWAETTPASALAIVLGDQPFLDVRHLTALRDAWLGGADLVASRFDGVASAPAVFDRARWPDLARLEGDRGAGALLRAESVATVAWADGAVDVDTEADLAGLASRPR